MSFPKYPKYKESGVEWLGDVPEHWDIVQVKRVAAIRYGIGEPPKYHEEGTPLIRATNVHAGRLFAEGMVFVDPSEIPEQRIVWLTTGDIIVVRSGAYTGDSAIIPEGFGPCIAGFDMVLRCHSARPRFIQFALLSNYLKEGQIDLEKMRAAQPHLNAEELGSCFLVLPSADDQNVIASFLHQETLKIDELVAEQRRLIELLKEKRQAVISHAVTKGLNHHAPMKPSGIDWLGDVPEHWSVASVRRMVRRIEQGWSPECIARPAEPDEWGVLKSGCVNRGVFVEQENKALPETLDPIPAYEIHPSDVLMSRASGSPELVGSTAYIRATRTKLMLSDKIFRIHPEPSIDREFFVAVFNSRVMRSQIERAISGAEGLANNLPQSAMKRFFCLVPPIDEQKEIVRYLATHCAAFDALTAEAERGIELLQERRTALISAAVTGKIDVRGFVEAEAA